MARISASTDAVLHGADLESGRAGGGTLTGLGMADQLLVPDLRGEKRWPRWTADMVGHGVGCVLVTPFHAPRGLPGAVTAYWSDPSPLRGEVCVIARLVAQQAEVDVAREELVGQLQAAMATRLIIGQAQGILMARFGMDTGQAFAVLRRYSQDCNVKLREIAAHLVLTGDLPLRPVRRHR
jgi:hypothetical protein